jgi:hypothetical protein
MHRQPAEATVEDADHVYTWSYFDFSATGFHPAAD